MPRSLVSQAGPLAMSCVLIVDATLNGFSLWDSTPTVTQHPGFWVLQGNSQLDRANGTAGGKWKPPAEEMQEPTEK